MVEITASVATAALVLFASYYGGRGYRALDRLLSAPAAISLVGTIAVAAGYVAHWYKQKNQRVYGRIEMVFGTVSAFAIAAAFAPERAMLPQCASLLGCTYVIARGLNNISEANAKAVAGLLKQITEKAAILTEKIATLQAQYQIPSDPA